MRHLLGRRSRPVLEALAKRRSLLAFDFDGTLAPIVDRPSAARMRAITRKRLREAGEAYPCAVISGRALDDVAKRLLGLRLACVVGNHGLEWGGASRASGATLRRVEDWHRRLAGALGGLEGVEIEDKGLSLSVHYRHSRTPRTSARLVAEAATSLPGARVRLGKKVVNVLPAEAEHKGTACRAIARALGAEATLYVGDDVTDEDVFAMKGPGLVSARVGASRTSRARYYLRQQEEIDELLAILAALRQRTDPRSPRPATSP